MNAKEFYNSLDNEVKEKLKTCKSLEEAKQTLEASKISLDPELLKSVSGGRRFRNTDDEEGNNNIEYWIVDGGGSDGGGC